MCVCLCFHVCGAWAQKSVLRLTDERLMNEVRVAPSPADGEKVTMNPPRFMWPDKFPHLGAVLDGVPGKEEKKPEVMYRVRISQDRNFAKGVIEGEQPWAFFNPFQQPAAVKADVVSGLIAEFRPQGNTVRFRGKCGQRQFTLSDHQPFLSVRGGDDDGRSVR